MKAFTFIPASIWANWTENRITYLGSNHSFIIHNDVIYFISDGCHVATKNGKNVSYNSEYKFPKGVKKFIKEIFSIENGSYFYIHTGNTNTNYNQFIHVFDNKGINVGGTSMNDNSTLENFKERATRILENCKNQKPLF